MSVSCNYPIIALLLCVDCTPLHLPIELPAGISISPPTLPAVYQTVQLDLRVSAQPCNAADSHLTLQCHSQRCYASIPLRLLFFLNLTLEGTICMNFAVPQEEICGNVSAGGSQRCCSFLVTQLLTNSLLGF